MQNRTNDRPKNKGFTLHAPDGTYLGFVTIGEFDRNNKRILPEGTVENLQNEDIMKGVIAAGELRPYKETEVSDTAGVDALIAGL